MTVTTTLADRPPTTPRSFLVAASGLLVAFLVLAIAVAARWSFPVYLDHLVEPVVHRWMVGRPGAVDAAVVVSDLGSPVGMDVLAAVAALALVWRHRAGASGATGAWKAAVVVVAVRVVELLVETVAKGVVDRDRPPHHLRLVQAGGASFPSGHSAGTAAVVGVLVLLLLAWAGRRPAVRAVVVVAGLFTVAVPVSRVALGVHYPSDVAGGVLLGLACAAAGWAALVAWTERAGDAPPR